ncbi:MAG: hypothetical protein QF751_07830, partial [Alphaproteobacteria bacterium]|nr:hypothetical protein [Alphaproteobacteria bacterium]
TMGMKKPPRNKPSTKPSWMVQKGLSQGLREVFPRLGNRPFSFQRGFPLGVPATFMVDKLLLNTCRKPAFASFANHLTFIGNFPYLCQPLIMDKGV